jgi:hypothetical protein
MTEGVQVLAGVLLPSATVFLLLLCNDRAVLGPWVNRRTTNVFTSAVVAVLVTLSVVLTASVLFPGSPDGRSSEIVGVCAVFSVVAGAWATGPGPPVVRFWGRRPGRPDRAGTAGPTLPRPGLSGGWSSRPRWECERSGAGRWVRVAGAAPMEHRCRQGGSDGTLVPLRSRPGWGCRGLRGGWGLRGEPGARRRTWRRHDAPAIPGMVAPRSHSAGRRAVSRLGRGRCATGPGRGWSENPSPPRE